MGYDKTHVDILDSKSGYDLAADEYKKYWKRLDSFYKIDFTRYIARGKKNIDVIDLGAGDGRLFDRFKGINYNRYVACDISEKMLNKYPGKIEKVVCDLNKKFSFDDMSFDLSVGFFILEYISDLETFFSEVYRILRVGGKLVIGYLLQRRQFVWKIDGRNFKIDMYKHSIKDIEKALKNNFFEFHIVPVIEELITIGYVIVCEKN